MTDTEVALRDALTDAAALVPISADPLADYRRRSAGPDRHRGGSGRSSGGGSGRWAVAGIAVTTAAVVVAAILIGTSGDRHQPSQSTAAANFLLTPRGAVSADGLRQSAAIIQTRLAGLGVHDPQVHVAGRALTVVASGASESTVQAAAGARGVLRFRQVLAISLSNATPGGATNSRGLAQSPHLTAAFGRAYNNWNCATNPNPTDGNDLAADYIIGCDASGQKYVLAPAAIEGDEVTSASIGRAVDGNSTQWVVDLHFSSAGATAWFNLTKKAFQVNQGQPSAPGSCQPPAGCNGAAIVLDGVVLSAPYSESDGIPAGVAQLAGTFTQRSAGRVVDLLNSGALPSTFAVARD